MLSHRVEWQYLTDAARSLESPCFAVCSDLLLLHSDPFFFLLLLFGLRKKNLSIVELMAAFGLMDSCNSNRTLNMASQCWRSSTGWLDEEMATATTLQILHTNQSCRTTIRSYLKHVYRFGF